MDFLEPSEWIKYGLSPMTVRLGEASARREEARDEATEASGGGTAPITVQQLGESSRSRTSSSSSNNNSSSRTLASGNPIKSASGPVGNHGQEMDVSDQEIMHYLNRTLDNVKKVRQELTSLYDPDKKDNYPPIVLLSSTRTPTVKGCLVNDRQEIIDGKYDRLLFGEGGLFHILCVCSVNC